MTQSIHQYLMSKKKRESFSFIVNNNGRFYRFKDELIPEAEAMKLFDLHFPLADKIRVDKFKGDNIGSANI